MSILATAAPVLAEEGYRDLILSVPHWLFEATTDLILGAIVYPFIRICHTRLVARAHREVDAAHGLSHPAPPPAAVLAAEQYSTGSGVKIIDIRSDR